MAANDYIKQKLYEAMLPLVSDGPLDKRLTFAGPALVVLTEEDFDDQEQRQKFAAIRQRLFATPLSNERNYVPRQMSEEDAKTLARDILSLYTAVMGGL